MAWRRPDGPTDHPGLRALHPDHLAAWRALSDLFLDTELTDSSYDAMARAVAAGGLSVEQLEAIVFHELAPGLGLNLLSVAGEWTFFDDDDLAERVKPRRDRFAFRSRLWRRLERRWWRPYLLDDWAKVADRVRTLRANEGRGDSAGS